MLVSGVRLSNGLPTDFHLFLVSSAVEHRTVNARVRGFHPGYLPVQVRPEVPESIEFVDVLGRAPLRGT